MILNQRVLYDCQELELNDIKILVYLLKEYKLNYNEIIYNGNVLVPITFPLNKRNEKSINNIYDKIKWDNDTYLLADTEIVMYRDKPYLQLNSDILETVEPFNENIIFDWDRVNSKSCAYYHLADCLWQIESGDVFSCEMIKLGTEKENTSVRAFKAYLMLYKKLDSKIEGGKVYVI